MLPQPFGRGQVSVAVKLQGRASSLELRIYSLDLALVRKLELAGNYQPGWNVAPFRLDGLADGIYFYVVRAHQGGESSARVLGKMAILR